MVHLKYIFEGQEIYFIVKYLYAAVAAPLTIFTYFVYFQLLIIVILDLTIIS